MRTAWAALSVIATWASLCPAAVDLRPPQSAVKPAVQQPSGGRREFRVDGVDEFVLRTNQDINGARSTLLDLYDVGAGGGSPLGMIQPQTRDYDVIYDQLAVNPVVRLLWHNDSAFDAGSPGPMLSASGSEPEVSGSFTTFSFAGDDPGGFNSFSNSPDPDEDPGSRLIAVPEPSAALMAGVGLALVVLTRLFRRRSS